MFNILSHQVNQKDFELTSYTIQMAKIMILEKLSNKVNPKKKLHRSLWEGETDKITSLNWEYGGGTQGGWKRKKRGEGEKGG